VKILHLSYSDNLGGAANAAFQLHRGLVSIGVESRMLVAKINSYEERIFQCPAHEKDKLHPLVMRWRNHKELKAQKRLFKEGKPTTYISEPHSEYDFQEVAWLLEWAEVINLHWVAGLVDWEKHIHLLAQYAPLVWTLHDQNPISGIWHFQPTEAENTNALQKLNAQIISKKTKVIAKLPENTLTAVTPSKWLTNEVISSRIMHKVKAYTIPYGIDTTTFRPRDKMSTRHELAITNDRFILGFIAHDINDPRKGLDILAAALQNLPTIYKDRILLMSLGCGESIEFNSIDSRHLGLSDNPAFVSKFYAALDVFICPSRQDNLPNTVLEALACGRPIIGSDVGGIPDMIQPGVTGWLTKAEDSKDLQANIIKVFKLWEDGKLNSLSEEIRITTEKRYALSKQASSYLELYERLTPKKLIQHDQNT
jgi:glycosyltransferase involved in cell wall biosynthesis